MAKLHLKYLLQLAQQFVHHDMTHLVGRTKLPKQQLAYFQSVVIEGTGKHAAVQGYTIGGKSGTSEPTAGNEDAGYVASFVAISPIENTQVVVLVVLYDPQGESFADVIIIMAVVIVNAVLGVVQESKAEAAIEALQTMTAATCKVLLSGGYPM